ncbi:hypothetical protein V8E54_001634 [Elaphomyces granulatus]
MPFPDESIRPLPQDVVAKIKSSTSITYLNGVIIELVKNSLDASARIIDVTVDYRRGGCSVEDDGHGIPQAEFELWGGLGKAYQTSKMGLGDDIYGRRGLFLASLAALSLLMITSRHARHETTNTMIFHHSKLISRLVPAPPQQTLNVTRHGTRVTVNDLFGNMPVRVKNRALAHQRPDDMEKEWYELKKMLSALLLACEKPVKLIVSETDKNKKLLIRAKRKLGPNLGPGDLAMDLLRTESILTQAGFFPPGKLGSWIPASAHIPGLTINSAISLQPSPTKQVQFISLGINPIFLQTSTDVLYNEVNQIFSASDFGTAGAHQELQVREKGTGRSAIQTKAVNRWPMFYIRIEMGGAGVSINDGNCLIESDKSLQLILDVLGQMIHRFLEEYGFRPRAVRHKRKMPEISSEFRRQGSQTFRKREVGLDNRIKLPCLLEKPVIASSRDFATLSRMKSGNEDAFDEICSGLPYSILPPKSEKPFLDCPKQTHRGIFRGGNSSIATAESNSDQQIPVIVNDFRSHDDGNHPQDRVIPFVDPFTNDSVFINSRTGQIVPRKPPTTPSVTPSHSIIRPSSSGSLVNPLGHTVIKRPHSAPSRTETRWLEKIMNKWNNPIFPRVEKSIPSITSDPRGDLLVRKRNGSGQQQCLTEISGFDTPCVTKFSGKLWKHGLAQADILAQIDRKFILIRMTSAPPENSSDQSGSLLVLIDQHAADERCRIEKLFSEMFKRAPTPVSSDEVVGVHTSSLTEPIVFEVVGREINLFKAYSGFFASWGCCYDVHDISRSGNATVHLNILPTLIVDRCRVEPTLVIDLLRSEIWKREESGKGSSRYSSQFSLRERSMGFNKVSTDAPSFECSGSYWVERVVDCPQGIINLLNSRACRSAIMFNDVLSLDDCRNLVSRLSQCVFPFQCAHGRPSMIPVLDMTLATDQENDHDLSDATRGLFGEEQWLNNTGTDLGFIEAFRAWKPPFLEV